MLKHFATQRKTNRNLLLIQLLVAIVLGAFFALVSKQAQGIAFALGAAIIALAHFLMAGLVFGGTVRAAQAWLGRFFLALMLKWLTVIALMSLFAERLMAAPMMALIGITASLVLIQLFNYLDAKVKRGS